jgi:hypothetical protein
MTPHIRNSTITPLLSAMMVSPSWADHNRTSDRADDRADDWANDRALHTLAGGRHDTGLVMRQTVAGWMVVNILSGRRFDWLFDRGPCLDKALSGAQ